MYISGNVEGTFEDEAKTVERNVVYEMELLLKVCAKNGRRGKNG